MPRQARIDIPGLTYHVIARGVEGRAIFQSVRDYEDFLERIPVVLKQVPGRIFAWALMPNHFHLLMRAGAQGLAPFMRRLMTGYATAYNLCHRRVGHLFQNRYKSLICEEDPYLMHLVRYIHLNPLKAKLVKDLNELERYPYTGHSAMLGLASIPWQDTEEVLGYFGTTISQSRAEYGRFVTAGLTESVTPGILGGGILEQMKGSRRTMERRREERDLYDDRILGESEFVQQVLEEVESREKVEGHLQRRGWDVRKLAGALAREMGMSERVLFERGRTQELSRAKATLIYGASEYLGVKLAELADMTKMTTSAASRARERGRDMFRGTQVAEAIEKSIHQERPQ